MNLYTINAGYFKLDGGAMFGVVPKSIWQKLNPSDENNMCSWALRCLLIEDGKRLILVDNGMGDKQDAKFFGHYHLHGNDTLDQSLAAHGYHRNDITDVILTHLHFDHISGMPDIPANVPLYIGQRESSKKEAINLFVQGSTDALLAGNENSSREQQRSLPVSSLQPGKYQPRTQMDSA